VGYIDDDGDSDGFNQLRPSLPLVIILVPTTRQGGSMSINRIIAVFVALVALMTLTLTHYSSSARAATPASPAAVITWNGIAQRAAMQVAG
jgi:hypothetical protein